MKRGAVTVKAYPGLVADTRNKVVDIKLFDNPIEASSTSSRGICQLALNELGQTAKYIRKDLLKGKDIGLTLVDIGSREEVASDILLASVRRACFDDDKLIDARSQSEFTGNVQAGKADIVSVAQEYEALLVESLAKIVEIKKRVKSSKNALALALCFGDIQAQLNEIFVKAFLFDQPWEWVKQIPRYLDAVLVRIEKAPLKPHVDRAATHTVQSFWNLHFEKLNKDGEARYFADPSWIDFRWMIEELRVSLYAQTLKTKVPVSEKRLKKQWDALS